MSILVELIKQDFGITKVGEGWWRSDTHSSLVVDSTKDKFYFNSRDLKGGPIDYLVNVRGLPRRSAEEFVKGYHSGIDINSKSNSIQVRFEKLVDLFHKAGRNYRDYWYDRGLTDETIDSYRLGYNDEWYLIPIYDEGKFINFQCRRDKPSKRVKFWYSDDDFKPVLYNSDIIKFVDTIYITEGMVDCILLNQLGFPCVCTTNGALSWNPGWIKFFGRVKEIYYVADNDKAGINAAKSVAKILGSRVHVLRFKDSPEKYGAMDYFKDGGTTEEFKQLLKENSVRGFERSSI